MRRLLVHVVRLAVALGAGAGCIAFVNDDPGSLTTTCHFQGESSACGQCAAAECGAPFDACCSSTSCAGTLAYLADCAPGAATLCTGLLVGAPELASCVATRCPACGAPDDGGVSSAYDAGNPVTVAGSTTCSKSGDSCFCEVGQQPNGTRCDPSTLPGPGLCCASYGWPKATGGTCSCEPFSCTPNTSGAMCDLSTNSTGTTTWGGDGCCTYGSFCECDPSSTTCSSPVTQCDVTVVGCDSSQVQVTSCSF